MVVKAAMVPCWGNRKDAISVNSRHVTVMYVATYSANVCPSPNLLIYCFLHYSKPPQGSGKQFLFLKDCFVSVIFFLCYTPKQAWKTTGWKSSLLKNLATFSKKKKKEGCVHFAMHPVGTPSSYGWAVCLVSWRSASYPSPVWKIIFSTVRLYLPSASSISGPWEKI